MFKRYPVHILLLPSSRLTLSCHRFTKMTFSSAWSEKATFTKALVR